MQSRPNRPRAFLDLLGAVVVTVDGPGGQEVGQSRQRLRYIAARGREHPLLGGLVGSGCGRQLARRRIEKRRLIGQQCQAQFHRGSRIQLRVQPFRRILAEPLGKLHSGNQPHHLPGRLVRRAGRGQRLLQLRHGDAFCGPGWKSHRRQKPQENQPSHCTVPIPHP